MKSGEINKSVKTLVEEVDKNAMEIETGLTLEYHSKDMMAQQELK